MTTTLRNYRIEAIDKNHFSHVFEHFFDNGTRAQRRFDELNRELKQHNLILVADLYKDDEFIESITL